MPDTKQSLPAKSTSQEKPETKTFTVPDRMKKVQFIASIGSSIGGVAGLVYAFKNNKGFWAYVGYSLLGSIVFGTLSGVGAELAVKK